MDAWTDILAGTFRAGASDGNCVEHLPNDRRALAAFEAQIEAARRRVWMSMYLLVPDPVGKAVLARMTDAARRGCDVLLLYDAVGSHRLAARHLRPLVEAGGRTAAFNRIWPPWRPGPRIGLRNHRKLLVADDVAICGGMNLSEAYVAGDDGVLTFDDTVLRVEGPCVADLAGILLDTWAEETGEHRPRPPAPVPRPGGIRVEVLPFDPRDEGTHLRRSVQQAIARAAERCRILTPYLVPPPWFAEALVEAAGRGVDVQVLTAGRTDRPTIRAAARHGYGPLLRAGVRIFELYGRVLHSKVATVDGRFGMVGSWNMDAWSSHHLLDLSLGFVDDALATSLEAEFEDFKRDASEYTLRDFERRGLPTRLVHAGARRLLGTL